MRRYHLTHFLVLFGIFGFTTFGFLTFQNDKLFQISLIIACVVSYISWGIVHHWLHNNLYMEIILEYVAIAIFGGIIALSVF